MSRVHGGGRKGWRLIFGVCGVVLLAAAAAWADDDPVEARAFEVQFRSLTDAADLVDPLLSDDGKIVLRPRLDTLVVEDRRSVLDKVATLLEGFDLPPRNVEISFSLFLGKREEPVDAAASEYGLSKEVRGVLEQLSDFTKWTTYEPLGSRSVTGTEGDRVVADLSADFRVEFTVESIHKTQGAVKFERLQLQRVQLAEDGTEEIENLYTTGMVLLPGELRLVGAATDPNSKRALFLALQTRPR